MQNKFRHEFKYSINYSDYLTIHSQLRSIMQPDPHVSSDGKYFIKSLYFDDPYDTALRDKIDGVNIREKFRIRMYNDDETFISLEKKSKINGLCLKESVPLTKEECISIIDNNYEFLSSSANQLMLELYTKMRSDLLKPKVLVAYIREPYIYEPGHIRITFDSELRTGLHSTEFFKSEKLFPAASSKAIIMEVKYDEFLPEVIACIIGAHRRAAAFSKYAECRMYD